MNVTEANIDVEHPPTWDLAYTFLEAYGLTSVAPDEILTWAQRMQDDEPACLAYVTNKFTNPDNARIEKCDE